MDGALFIFYQQFVDYGQLAKVIIFLRTVSVQSITLMNLCLFKTLQSKHLISMLYNASIGDTEPQEWRHQKQ